MRKALLVLSLAASTASAQDWTRFRGPNGTGVSEAKGLPTAWSESDILWKLDLPGVGHSQPVVWDDKLFITVAKEEGKERALLAIGKAEGKVLWTKAYPMATHAKHKFNSFASSSAAVDKDRVYVPFVSAEQFVVRAFDHAGKELWASPLGAYKSQHGYGASPIIHENTLIVTSDQDAESFIVALDLKTGKPVWKSPRRNTDQSAAYGTPCVHQGQLLTTSGSHGIAALDLKTGKQLWEAKVFDKRAVSSPVVVGDLVFGSCGSGGGGNYVAAVKLGGKGDVTASHKAYEIRKAAPYVPTPVALGDRLFLTADNGIASCVKASTGDILWSERIADGFYGSPVLAEGHVYIASTKGEMIVFAAADEFKVIGRSPLGEGSHSTPCLDGSRLYIRTFTKLICVGKK
jgi:outer membrane protein assembly factor BamB